MSTPPPAEPAAGPTPGRPRSFSGRAALEHPVQPLDLGRHDLYRVAGQDASDARWETYEAQKQVFQPVTELPPDGHMVVDCDEPWAECVEQTRRELERRLAPPP